MDNENKCFAVVVFAPETTDREALARLGICGQCGHVCTGDEYNIIQSSIIGTCQNCTRVFWNEYHAENPEAKEEWDNWIPLDEYIDSQDETDTD